MISVRFERLDSGTKTYEYPVSGSVVSLNVAPPSALSSTLPCVASAARNTVDDAAPPPESTTTPTAL